MASAAPGGDLQRFFPQNMRAIGQLSLVHAKDGIALGGMQSKPAAFNVIAFQAAQHVVELFMRRRRPEIVSARIAALQEAQFNAKGFAFLQQARVRAMVLTAQVFWPGAR